jgi:OmpA-OmpF porin, OOP family
MKVMRRYMLMAAVCLLGFTFAHAQMQDFEDCKDYPLFNRIPNTFIYDCSQNFDVVAIQLTVSKIEEKEGTKTYIAYTYDPESNVKPPSFFQIVKNYENAVVSKGGKKVFYGPSYDLSNATLFVKSGNKDVWIILEDQSGTREGQYTLTILEIEAMKQEIVASDILAALNADGYIPLYLHFATGKYDIDPSDEGQITQIAQMLKSNPGIKLSIEGHTDNVGDAASNLLLSENRAKSIMNALIAKGIDKTRLSAKGLGQTAPIADNRTEAGRASNRRVEIVKK